MEADPSSATGLVMAGGQARRGSGASPSQMVRAADARSGCAANLCDLNCSLAPDSAGCGEQVRWPGTLERAAARASATAECRIMGPTVERRLGAPLRLDNDLKRRYRALPGGRMGAAPMPFMN
jgi:hypothetical protein